jgi:hypothetical protein
MPLITPAFFDGTELNIPNLDKEGVNERLLEFIEKYERKFLIEMFGYPFYTAMQAGLLIDPVPGIWENLISGNSYGEYHFRGLVESATSIVSLSNNYQYKPPVLLKVGVNIPSGDTSIAMADWIGFDPLIEKAGGFGTQVRGQDYTFNSTTGEWALIDNIFVEGEYYQVQFPLKSNVTVEATGAKRSIIANYIYYWWQRDNQTQSTSTGESKAKKENAYNVSGADKAARAWNEMRDGVLECYGYLQYNYGLYPTYYTYNFGFMNTLF